MWLWNKRQQLKLSHANIVFDGNSITAWEDATASGKWTDRLKLLEPYTASTCTFTNVAVPGRSTSALDITALTVVDNLYVPGRLNICCIWEVINDIGNGTPARACQMVENYCKARRNKGWKVVVFSLQAARVAAGGITTQAAFDTARNTYNQWLATNWRNFADAYVDVNISVKLNRGLVADVPDGIHPSSSSLNEILPIVDTALKSIKL